MKNNPLPDHSDSKVNAIKEYSDLHVVKEVERVKTHMLVIHEKLIE